VPLGTEVGLGPGYIVLDGDRAPRPRKGAQNPPHFSAHFAVALSPISSAAEHLFTTAGWVISIDREFEFYEFFSFLKFNEFYEFLVRLKKIRKKFVILQIIDV